MGDCSTDERVTLEAGEIHVSSVYVRPGRRAVRPDRVQSLADSIRDIGLQNPIVIRADGRLISGAHRLEAYRLLGRDTIPCRVAPMDGELWLPAISNSQGALIDELQEIDENLQRAELTALEQGEMIARRKTIYETLHPETKHGGDRKSSRSNCDSNEPRFSEDTSRLSGISERSVQVSAQIGAMPAEVRDAVRDTPLADNQQELLKLAREAKRDPAQAVRIAEAARDTQAKRVTDARSVVRQAEIRTRAEEAPPASCAEVELFAVPVAALHEFVAAASVDLILTDPPYDEEHLDVFSHLADFAAHALKPGGHLAVMSGQTHLPAVFLRLTHPALWYRWTLAYLTPGGQSAQVWARSVNTFWKPVLLYQKAGVVATQAWLGDVARSDTNDNDKRFHHWGQSESGMLDLLSRLSLPGDIVCDPFLGGGATGVVAVTHHRVFIGADLDAECVGTFRARLAEVLHESV